MAIVSRCHLCRTPLVQEGTTPAEVGSLRNDATQDPAGAAGATTADAWQQGEGAELAAAASPPPPPPPPAASSAAVVVGRPRRTTILASTGGNSYFVFCRETYASRAAGGGVA